ncbi:Avirulence (Avh) protein [Phytophthora megakarya]|uniref:Avirulence (Avh) protein n=1 Tax=Phytophthora megakarya TaxID=4795 RepID=A0A225W1L1_9STRA|nr:Avirulence (Avh) protein [Phytophthora megakarya]
MEPQSMFRTLIRHYGDIQLSSMLEAATKVESTRDVATKLQGEQMKLWERRGVTSKQLFKTLKLNIFDDGVTNLLASPSMNTWIKYADKVDPGPRTTLFDKLRNAYSDDTMLSKLLTTGMKDPNTEKLANELQAKQVNRWLDDLQPPENVFKFFSLDKGADGLLANPQLRTWVTYSDRYKANNEFTTKLSLTEVLTKHYKDKDLVIMIRSAKSKREFEYGQSIQDALLDKWAKARKPVGEVLEALGVTRTQAQSNGVMEAYNKKFLALNPK